MKYEYKYDDENNMIIKYIENKGNMKEFIESLGVRTYKKEYEEIKKEYDDILSRSLENNKILIKQSKKLNQMHNSKAYKILRWFEKLFSYRVVVVNLEDEEI
jgi:alcohol dehydrogenase YqhD (iron-dependent ADH family)|tara:strand:+ start:558 stop:863 length:306 start_codon:yes stop_codon:yes gene_type:complete